jgi:amino acid adenylation domain-containing protein
LISAAGDAAGDMGGEAGEARSAGGEAGGAAGEAQSAAAQPAAVAGVPAAAAVAGVPAAAAMAAPPGGLDRELLARTAPERRRELLASWLGEVAAAALGMAPARPDPGRPLTAYGLDSLGAVEVQGRLQADLGVEISIADLLAGASLSDLAAAALVDLAAAAATPVAAAAEVPEAQGPAAGRFPLAANQQALWFIHQLAPRSLAYHLAGAARFTGRLDREALGRALAALAERHPALRTTFHDDGDGPWQEVAVRAPVELLELAAGDGDGDSEAALVERLRAAAFRPFDLERGPLWRVGLLSGARPGSAPDGGLLLLAIHHLVADFWSLQVMVRDLAILYSREAREARGEGAAAAGPEPAPSPLGLRYTDFVRWQRQRLAGPAGERLWRHWRLALQGELPRLALPTDRPWPPVQTWAGAACSCELPEALVAGLEGVARDRGATLFMVLLAAFQALLGRLAGGTRIVVGSPTHGRDGRAGAALADLVGYFVNLVPLAADLGGDPSFAGLVTDVRAAALAAFEHREMPLALLAERLLPERDAARSPFFDVLFAFEKGREARLDLGGFALGMPGSRLRLGGAVLSSLEFPPAGAPFALSLMAAEVGRGLGASLQFNTDLFDRATALRMSGHLRRLLEAAARDPERRLSELPLLSPAESHQVLREWNDAAAAYPGAGRCLHELVWKQAARRPDAPAVAAPEGLLTYGELAAAAGRLAGALRGRGVAPDQAVAVCAERSLEMVVGLLGVLAAGGAYVPLDPDFPRQRLAFMLDDCGATVLLAQRRLLPRLAPLPEAMAVLALDGADAADAGGSSGSWAGSPGPLPENLAYVIYTSGSTGRPKGAMNSHRAVVNRLLWAQQTYGLAASDRVLQKTPISFDVSVWELFWPLAAGATLVLARPGGHQDPAYLARLIAEQGITTLHFVPSMMHAFLDAPDAAAGSAAAAVRRVFASGEALPGELARRCQARFGQAALHNLYGPTEAAVEVTAWQCEPESRRAAVPIGRPVGNARIHLLDAAFGAVPIGVAGELYIGGAPPARGYRGRPEMTAERFVPDPFGGSWGAPGARLYRTGDLARLLPGGAIDFLGRIDGQVKVRGVRIELAEIEEMLAGHPAVRQAAAGVVEAAPGDRRLVAWIVPAADAATAPAEGELRAFLRRRLPEAMVPAAYVVTGELPRNPSGKLDRRALPAPRWGRGEHEAVVPPRTPAEEILAGIWREVLRVERIGVHDSFFALGGHSLLAARLMSRVRRAFGVELPLAALFTAPTVAALAARLEAGRGGAGGEDLRPAAEPIAPRPRPALPPLSFAQERLWFLDQLEPGSVTYNVPAALRLTGELAWAPLAGAITGIVSRHEALRTRFPEVSGRPVQNIEPAARVPLPVVDLGGLAAPAAAAEGLRLAAAEAEAPFALAGGPLLRARLVALGGPAGSDWLLLVSCHHIVFDGASVEVFWRELATLYGALAAGHPSPLALLAPLPIQYLDYALWQRRRLDGPALGPLVAGWRSALAGAPPALELPADRPRPAVRGSRGGRRLLRLGADVSDAVAALARGGDATSFMVLLAAFATLLGRAGEAAETGASPAVVIGSPVANRDRLELEPLIGFFVNTLPLHVDLAADPAFGELLGRVRRAALAAYALQELPFEKLVEELAPERDPGRTPLFQAMLGFRDREAASPGLPGVRAELLPSLLRRAKFDLVLSLENGADGLAGDLEYSAELFDAATAERLAGHFSRLLEAAVRDPGRRLSELPLLGAAERHQLLWAWNDVSWEYPRQATLAEVFAAAVARRPDAVALVMDASPPGAAAAALTYAELDRAANRLANHLAALGARPEDRIALCLPRSTGLIVAILAGVKAGGAYVPLDPAYPAERLAWMLADCGAAIVVTAGDAGAALPAAADGLARVDLERDRAAIGRASPAPPPAAAAGSAGQLACLLYTSGSTGTPKGVAVTARGVVRLALGGGHARLGPDRVLAHLSAITFDAATFEIWGALANGARLVILPPGAPSLDDLGAALARHQVTTLFLTTALFHEMVKENLDGLAPLAELFTGGEAVSLAHLLRAAAELPHTRLFDVYGPTEDTTYATCWPLASGGGAAAGSPPIGRPIAGTEAYVLDGEGRLLPRGFAGELALGGDGLARGYWRRPELTAERFRPHPFSRRPGERLYLTGDRVRHLADGNLQFLGRVDRQIKVRGFRVEPGEIEAALAAHPGVAASVVVVREDRPGDKRLVAYVAAPAAGQAPGQAELRRHLAARLPAHMIPGSLVLLPALPVTAHGKIDRRALPTPGPEAGDGTFAAPRDPFEELLAGIWREVLGVERVGVHDNFFALGGHSLLAARLMSRVRRAFGVELPLAALFEAPTVAGLAARLDGQGPAGPGAAAAGAGAAASGAHAADGAAAGRRDLRPAAAAIVPGPRPALPPLSFSQERLWFLDQLEPGNVTYNVPAAVRLTGDLAWAPLAGAITGIVARHEALRTCFPEVSGQPIQRIEPPAPVPLPVVDLAGLAAPAAAAEALRLAAAEAQAPFALAGGPLLRARLLALGGPGGRDWLLLLSFHHIVFDGGSVEVFWRELETLYGALAAGGAAPLPPLPIQYLDYALWQRRCLDGPALAPLVAAWRAALAGAPPALELPADRPRPAVRGSRGGRRLLRLGAGISGAVAALARGEDATSFMVLLAAFATLLGRAGGGTDLGAVVIGSPVANRDRLELEPLIGFFVNTLPLHVDLTGDPAFGELLGRVRRVALAAYVLKDLPFEKLVEELSPPRDPSRTPVFQAMLAFRDREPGSPGLPGVRAELLPTLLPRAKFDLLLSLASGASGLAGDLEYSAELFDAATAERLAAHFSRLLEAAARDPRRRLSELPLLSPAESHQVLREWNDAAAAYPGAGRCLHQLVAEQAARRPDAPAVAAPEGLLTYGELAAAAGRLAGALRGLGVAPDQAVAVCAERSLEMVVGLLGVLAAGGAYVPLDPDFPRQRLAFMLGDCGATVLLAQRRLLPRLAPLPAAMAVLALDGAAIAAVGATGAIDAIDAIGADASGSGARGRSGSLAGSPGPLPENLAYVIYTSGSTGRPKGAMNSHRAVVNRLLWAQQTYGLAASDRVLQKTPISFDVSVWELFWPLAAGATLVLARPGGHQDPAYLARLIAEQGITTLHFVPSMMQEFLDAPDDSCLASVRRVFASGEALPGELARRCHARLGPAAALYNLYGPTEAAVEVTAWGSEPGSRRASVPIGRPVGNARIHLLDAACRPVPIGVPGELHIGGLPPARGYLGRPEMTAERFVPDPFGGDWGAAGARLYRTGDLARRLPGGAVDFLGRRDGQVKVRGVRIELAEIEEMLARHPAIRQAAAGVHEVAAGDLRLVAWIVPAGAAAPPPAAGELRAFLRQRLPEAMVPAAYVVLAELPRNPSGKLDRRALPAPRWGRGEQEAVALPRTPAEELLAGIWRQVLGVERIGIHDSFFDLGGHSLLATRLVSRVRRAFGVELPLARLFEEPTVAGLAARLGAAAGAAPLAAHELKPRQRPPLPPLSFAQERLWFLDRMEPGGALYNLPAAARLAGELAVPALAASLGEIVRRHEALRTRFGVAPDGQPVQLVSPWRPLALPLLDLAAVPAARRGLLSARLLEQLAVQPFDLAAGPLLRAALLRLAAGEHVLLLAMHHIVADGWSLGVLLRELARLYPAALAGRPSPLAELPIQYVDFALWQREWLSGERLAAALAGWRDALAGAPAALALPADRPWPAVRASHGAQWPLALEPALAAAVNELARRSEVTPFMLLLAAWGALLGRVCGQEDVLVGTAVANRTRLEIEPLIGFFVNTLPLRIELGGEPDLATLLARVRRTTLAAYERQDLPFERLVLDLAPERDLSRAPLVQAMLALQDAQLDPRLPGLELEAVEIDTHAAKLDLSLTLWEAGGGFAGGLEYATDLFDAATAERLAGCFRNLLAALVADPAARVLEAPLLGPAEREQMLALVAGVAAPAAPADGIGGPELLHERFERQAARTPHAVAVELGDERFSYGGLDALANRVARRLRRLGAAPEVTVACGMPPSPAMVAALLGVLRAGAAFLPLDPELPETRRAFMLRDSGARLLLIEEAASAPPPPAGIELVAVGRDLLGMAGMAGLAEESAEPLRGARPAPDNLAYVLYTSGSTGEPKGVAVDHAAAAAHMAGILGLMEITSADRVLQFAAPAFDAAIEQILPGLGCGATVVLRGGELWSPAGFFERLATLEVTVADLPTAYWQQAVRYSAAAVPGARTASLRLVSAGGEAMPFETARLWAATPAAGARLLNGYGPTEAVIGATWQQVDAAVGPPGPGGAVPIGKPLAGRTALVLDRRLGLVPAGVTGELFLGGLLARGYLGRPALTAERFVPDPFAAAAGNRLYRSGDLVRRRADGVLEFMGRVDHQVKIRGQRVELGEVAAALAGHPRVREAVVVAHHDGGGGAGGPGGDLRLVAYVVPLEAVPEPPPAAADRSTAAAQPVGPARPVPAAQQAATAAQPAAPAWPAAAAVEGPTAAQLREFLRQRLPSAMVPADYVFLAALPLSPQGKVDRRALPPPPAPSATPGIGDPAAAALRGPVEELVAGIWEELLGVERVGPHDNFFDLGGHSLLATQVISRLRAATGVEMPIRRLFETPTVAGLAAEIERLERQRSGAARAPAGGTRPAQAPQPLLARRRAGAADAAPASPEPGPEPPLPLSFSQERLWFLDRFEPGSLLNMPAAVRLAGGLDVPALGATIDEVLRRHQVLRTAFVELPDGRPAQQVQPFRPRGVPVVDLAGLPAAAREAEAQRLAAAEAARPFDLGGGQGAGAASAALLRAALLRLGAGEHGLLLTMHHIASDAWSWGLLLRELEALYAAYAAGRPSPLPELGLQYADFALWQRDWLAGEVLEEQLGYWRRALAGPPAPLELPTDRLRPAVQTYTAGERPLRLPAALAGELKALGRRRGATLFMTLLAAVELVFGRLSGQDDVVVGTPIAGRNRAEIEPLIGLFLNHLVLRTDLAGDPSFAALLARVRETTLAAYAHQDLPFEKLLAEIKPERDLSRTPLFQVLFNLVNVPDRPLRLPGLAVSSLAVAEVGSKFDMTFYVEEVAGEVSFHLVYNADLFDGARMGELLSQIESALVQAAAAPDSAIGSFSLLTEAARAVLPCLERPLAATWQGAFHEQFARQALRLPGKTAVSDPEESWTYADLDAETNRLASWLRAGGLASGEVVAIHAHRSAPLVVAVLGTLKAGGVFLLLDPAYPPRRQAELLALAGARAFIQLAATGELPEPLAAAVAALPGRLRLVLAPRAASAGAGTGGGGGAASQLGAWPATAPACAVGPDDPCVLTFTSGSTGVPKGVLGRHGSLAHFAPWAARRLGLSDADRSTMTSGLAHDPMQRDICVPLQLGATLCIPDPVALWSPGWLAEWLRREEITFVNLTPAMVQLLAETAPVAAGPAPAAGGPAPVRSLRLAFLVGDVLTRRQVEQLAALAPGVTCVNLYGSTEGQRAVSHHLTGPAAAAARAADARAEKTAPAGAPDAREVLPLGRGIDEVELLVLDRRRRLAGTGELGELAIRSPHLALGYLNDPPLTAERFVANPATGQPRDRIYLTGDLGRYRPDGEAEFVARADNQIKIRGFRIEPAEIEMALVRHPALREAAVVARADRAGDKRLVAYVVPAGDEAPPAAELQDFLRQALPEHMVPAAWVTLERLPMTVNGKLDRRALPEPVGAGAEEAAAYVPPATEAERAVAAIWQDVLGVERVGVEDKFFHLGGHSLLLVRVQARLQQRFGRGLSILDLFKYPDVRSLARFLAAGPAGGAPQAAAAAAEEEADAERAREIELGKARRRQRLARRHDPDVAGHPEDEADLAAAADAAGGAVKTGAGGGR